MALTISNNPAVAAASTYLEKNQKALQTSIKRLASGRKFVGGGQDDPGNVAVAMRIGASMKRIAGAESNIANSISFLEFQDGILDTIALILSRMSELKGLATSDPMKSADDISSYLTEFNDLMGQLKDLTDAKINGTNVFSTNTTLLDNPRNSSTFVEDEDYFTVYTSEEGMEGSSVKVYKSLILSALQVNDLGTENMIAVAAQDNTAAANSAKNFAGTTAFDDLADVNLNQIEYALESVTWLRGQNAAGQARLSFAQDSLATQKMNLGAALGRIEDADMAEESSNVAKYSILMQASAAMVAQANQSQQVALTLLS